MMSTLLAIAALIIGFLVAFVWQQNRFKNAQKEASDKLSETSKALEIAQYELSRLKEEKQFAAA
jgi:low temperature requirement protein LtrA